MQIQTTYEFHPIADIFPMMTKEELSDLTFDIEEHGLLEPIVLYEGKILDGRNRFLACGRTLLEEGQGYTMRVEPEFVEYEGTNPLQYVVSMNLKRRHLTESQKAAIAVEAKPMFAEEARRRQATSTGGAHPQLKELIPEGVQARDQVGALFGVSGRYVDAAEYVQDRDPERFAAVKAGEITLTKAVRELKKQELQKKVPEFPNGKYRVLYADPPWQYSSKGPDYYGPAERHYPTMTIAELCLLDVRERLTDNAVLFLWVPSPLLDECWPVIKAWGFEYKASFVWDKVKHNYGHYNSVRHEFLLVCTRGSCLPDVKELEDSVVSLERTSEHSEKPEYFRGLIDRLYPEGPRLELFARKQSDGWESYGNEL
ncbi:MAG: MT-A70 family methyltransferase [bacterium]|nr:MT-A70 family methyltransferase [bacterium]